MQAFSSFPSTWALPRDNFRKLENTKWGGRRDAVRKLFIRIIVMVALTVFVLTLGAQTVFSQSPPTTKEKPVVVELHDDFFQPKEITIPQGKKTVFWLKNKGLKDHTFTIKELDVDVEVKPGVEKMVTIEPEKSGTFQLICRFHEKEGMVGTVTVQ